MGKVGAGRGISRKQVRRVLHHNHDQIRYCYERSIEDNDGLQGKVAIRWVIAPSGDVVSTELVESSVGEDGLVECMRAKIARWRFPAPKDGQVAVVNFPWLFKPAG